MDDPRVTYDDDEHKYYDAVGEVPSVTRIIRWYTRSPWHGRANEWHRDRGHAVHRMIEMEVAGILDDEKVDPALIGFIQAWRDFVEASEFEAKESEAIVYHGGMRFAGRADLVGAMHGADWLIDVKSGARADWHTVQTYMYRSAAIDWRGLSAEKWKRATLYLTEGGRFNFVPAWDEEAIDVAAMMVAWWTEFRGEVRT